MCSVGRDFGKLLMKLFISTKKLTSTISVKFVDKEIK
ncbi:unnamed protein product [Acanthoscelides obtectus]|uniref:Uncharacterized protein n=1 Tax=Acanthoscelides obtectus TaxID=200917 RepID=A0A9P0LF69_ACAOB|nr:unnamed protein product [Acanthoscelides obtectus]CAK1624836.1 hypothetical protein AOBTE_LOCUS2792 [Acanthoscelides obtectus]